MRSLILAAAAACLIAGPATAKETKDAATVAVFELSGALTETPAAADDPFSTGKSESLTAMTGRLRKAAADDTVQAVVLNYGGLSLGRAQAEELAAAVETVKAAGKPVWGYADALILSGYTLMTPADTITLSPEGALIVTGIYGEQMFLRGMLDKIGVEPDFVALGDYKAAGEQFMRKSPSDFAQKNTDWLFDSLYESMLEDDRRGPRRGRGEGRKSGSTRASTRRPRRPKRASSTGPRPASSSPPPSKKSSERRSEVRQEPTASSRRRRRST